MRMLILGAGPAGLGAAWRLRELGRKDFLVLEAEDRVGGLSSSVVDSKGFLWDMGGHVEYSHYEYFDAALAKAMPAKAWLEHDREAWVWAFGRFIPYPFQYNIRHLPPSVLRACLRTLPRKVRTDSPSFEEWALSSFGSGIARAFMLPYNRKLWSYPLSRLGSSWVAGRVAAMDPSRVRRNVRSGEDDRAWGGNRTFRYPRTGGTGAVWDAVADRIGRDRIRLRSRVVSVDAMTKRVRLANGRWLGYDVLINTSPLDVFAQRVRGLSEGAKRAAARLRHNSIHIVGLGLRGAPPELVAPKFWIYFPEKRYAFYRVEILSNFSPNNVPTRSPHWSVLVEMSGAFKDPVRGLIRAGIIRSKKDIVDRWHRRIRHGYPLPTLDRDGLLARVQPELEKLDIHSIGRFGAWRYEEGNQDHCFMQGVGKIDELGG
ncbi:MAG: FAD-dependent oxidoreductase [Elusimicrobiota bacterium]